MPSFDAVSEVDLQELNNAVDQANREIGTRYDFRGVDAKYARIENEVTLLPRPRFSWIKCSMSCEQRWSAEK